MIPRPPRGRPLATTGAHVRPRGGKEAGGRSPWGGQGLWADMVHLRCCGGKERVPSSSP